MAWIDDRLWCHPKIVGVSKQARWAYVAGLCYSSGFGTQGRLSGSQLSLIGVSAGERAQLVAAGLWEDEPGGVVIHDWNDHNEARDRARRLARERKRRQRLRETSPPDDVTHVTRDITHPERDGHDRVVKSEEVTSSRGFSYSSSLGVTAGGTAPDFRVPELLEEMP